MDILQRCVTHLPPLAWCARFTAGRPDVEVRHGTAVECFEDGLVAGAWDDDFGAHRPDRAVTLAGTALRADGRSVVLAAGSNLLDRLYLVQTDRHLFASNSLVFAAVAAGDAPRPEYRFYARDFFHQVRAGIERRQRAIPLRRGHAILHEFGNVRIDADLGATREPKPVPAAPADYDAYVALVSGAIGKVFANAAHPARRVRYRPIATLSRGYDANAVACLARRHGCDEAFSYDDLPEDCGGEVGSYLGLKVHLRDRGRYRARRDLPEAQFCVYPRGSPAAFASFEDLLRHRLVLTGFFGDDIFSLDPHRFGGNMAQHTFGGLAGSALVEFALRLPLLQLAPLHVGAQHIRAVIDIARSEEMRPYRLATAYDRPIARRILEQAGVPRRAFGQTKHGTGALRTLAQLGPHSRADYDRFVRTHAPLPARALVALHHARVATVGGVAARAARAHLWRPPRAAGPTQSFLLQWGFEHTAPRYQGAW